MKYKKQKKVYFLLDCSSSMIGEPIEAVKQSIKVMLAEWKEMEEDVCISVIAYQSVARELLKNVSLEEFLLPRFLLGGLSCFKDACKLLEKQIQKDEKPILFLFTDGKMTDDWLEYIQKNDVLKNIDWVVCAAGAEAEIFPFQKITNSIVTLSTLTYGEFGKFLEL